MTDFHVECVKLGPVYRHQNADNLSITDVGAYPVIFRTGDFEEGQLAVYVPVDSVVPLTDPRWDFLSGKDRIRARKLRGVFSQGLLTTADPDMIEGEDVAERLGITKFLTQEEKNEQGSNGPNKSKSVNVCPSFLPRYTDLENLRRHAHVLVPGELVLATEKLHGESVAFCYSRFSFFKRLWNRLTGGPQGTVICRSRNQIKTSGKWFELIDKLDLTSRFERLDDPESCSIYGESYGYLKGFKYGTDGDGSFRVFDIYDREFKEYLDYTEARSITMGMGLNMVPLIYHGPYDFETLAQLAEGESVLGEHVKEGIVVKPEHERYEHCGRVIFKLKGEGFLLSGNS